MAPERRRTTLEQKSARFDPLLAALCAGTAAVLLAVCSWSSPLYPYHCGGDANIYFTIGRNMLDGLVPYRDLIDQKGPLLFFIQMLGALVSRQSFLGVWLLEVAAGTVFLYFSARTVQLFAPRAAALLGVPLTALAAWSGDAFASGSTAEEYTLPALAFGLYLFCRAFARDSRWRPALPLFFVNGLLAGAVLWTKYTMLGFHFAWMASFALLLWLGEKDFGRAVRSCLVFLGGMAAVSAAVLAWFGANGALDELWGVYFYRNIFHYGTPATHWSEPLYNILMAGAETLLRNPLLAVLCVLGALAAVLSRSMLAPAGRAGLCALVFFTALFMWGASRGFPYYGLLFACFLPLGVAAAGRAAQRFLPRPGKLLAGVLAGLCAVCAALSFWLSPNTWFMGYEREELPQSIFADYIREQGGETLLTWGILDVGFYTFSDITPTCPYFCRLNLFDNEELEGMAADMVRRGEFDFVVTANNHVMYEELTEHYELVLTATEPTPDGRDAFFNLYQRVK